MSSQDNDDDREVSERAEAQLRIGEETAASNQGREEGGEEGQEEGEDEARETTQTDHLNKQLLSSFLGQIKDKTGSEILAMFTQNKPPSAEPEGPEQDWGDDNVGNNSSSSSSSNGIVENGSSHR